MRRGYLKPSLHASGEAVLFVRLPELLASEASIVLASGLIERGRADAVETARSMVSLTSRLPLGDIIAAHSFADAMRGNTGVPLDVVSEMVGMPPERTPITPGMKAAIHVPGIGMMEMTFQADGSFVGESDGQRHTFTADPGEGPGELIGHSHAWLILSHLAGQRIGIVRGSDTERIDLELLAEVGRCPHPLRRPDSVFEGRGILTHHIAGYGEVSATRPASSNPSRSPFLGASVKKDRSSKSGFERPSKTALSHCLPGSTLHYARRRNLRTTYGGLGPSGC